MESEIQVCKKQDSESPLSLESIEEIDMNVLRKLLEFYTNIEPNENYAGFLLSYYKATRIIFAHMISNKNALSTVKIKYLFSKQETIGIGRLYGYSLDLYSGKYNCVSLQNAPKSIRSELTHKIIGTLIWKIPTPACFTHTSESC